MRNPLAINRLLSLFVAPLIWVGHFVLCYVVVSLACAYRFDGARIAVVLLTLAAGFLLGMVAWSNARKWRSARRGAMNGDGLDLFFAKTSLMLCGLTAVALAWVAFPAALLAPCAA